MNDFQFLMNIGNLKVIIMYNLVLQKSILIIK